MEEVLKTIITDRLPSTIMTFLPKILFPVNRQQNRDINICFNLLKIDLHNRYGQKGQVKKQLVINSHT